LNDGEITVYGDGIQTRDFTFIDDVIEANILAATNEIKGEVFNVGGGSRISVTDLIKLLEKITGEKARIKHIEKQKGDVMDTLADTGKIRGLGWKPGVKIEEELKRFVGWYKNHVRNE
jgi:UDP-glucose 4-epimerase